MSSLAENESYNNVKKDIFKKLKTMIKDKTINWFDMSSEYIAQKLPSYTQDDVYQVLSDYKEELVSVQKKVDKKIKEKKEKKKKKEDDEEEEEEIVEKEEQDPCNNLPQLLTTSLYFSLTYPELSGQELSEKVLSEPEYIDCDKEKLNDMINEVSNEFNNTWEDKPTKLFKRSIVDIYKFWKTNDESSYNSIQSISKFLEALNNILSEKNLNDEEQMKDLYTYVRTALDEPSEQVVSSFKEMSKFADIEIRKRLNQPVTLKEENELQEYRKKKREMEMIQRSKNIKEILKKRAEELTREEKKEEKEDEEEKEKIFRDRPLDFVQSEPAKTKEEFEKLKQIVDSIIEQSIETIRKQKKLSLDQVNKVKQKVRKEIDPEAFPYPEDWEKDFEKTTVETPSGDRIVWRLKDSSKKESKKIVKNIGQHVSSIFEDIAVQVRERKPDLSERKLTLIENQVNFLKSFLEESEQSNKDIEMELKSRRLPVIEWKNFLNLPTENRKDVAQKIVTQFDSTENKFAVQPMADIAKEYLDVFKKSKVTIKPVYEEKLQDMFQETLEEDEEEEEKEDEEEEEKEEGGEDNAISESENYGVNLTNLTKSLVEEYISLYIKKKKGGKIMSPVLLYEFRKWIGETYPNSPVIDQEDAIKSFAEIIGAPKKVKTDNGYKLLFIDIEISSNVSEEEQEKIRKAQEFIANSSVYNKTVRLYIDFNKDALKANTKEKLKILINDYRILIQQELQEDMDEKFINEYIQLWSKYTTYLDKIGYLTSFTHKYFSQRLKTKILKNPLVMNPTKRARRLRLLNEKEYVETKYLSSLPSFISKNTRECIIWNSIKPWFKKSFDYVLIGDAFGNMKLDLTEEQKKYFGKYDSSITQDIKKIYLYRPTKLYNYLLCKLNTENDVLPQCDYNKKGMFSINIDKNNDLNLYTVLVKNTIEYDKATDTYKQYKRYHVMTKEDYDTECEWWKSKQYSRSVTLANIKNNIVNINDNFYVNLPRAFSIKLGLLDFYKMSSKVYKGTEEEQKRQEEKDKNNFEKSIDDLVSKVQYTIFSYPLLTQGTRYFTLVKQAVIFTMMFQKNFINSQEIFKTYNMMFNVNPADITQSYLNKIYNLPIEYKFPEVFFHPDSITRIKLIEQFDKLVDYAVENIMIDIFNYSFPDRPRLKRSGADTEILSYFFAKHINTVVSYCKSVVYHFSKDSNLFVWYDITAQDYKTFEIETDRFFVEVKDLAEYLSANLARYNISFSVENNRLKITNNAFNVIRLVSQSEAEEKNMKNCVNSLLGFTESYTSQRLKSGDSYTANKFVSIFKESSQELNVLLSTVPEERIISIPTRDDNIVCIDMLDLYNAKQTRLVNKENLDDFYILKLIYLKEPVVVSPNIVDIIYDQINASILKQKVVAEGDEPIELLCSECHKEITSDNNTFKTFEKVIGSEGLTYNIVEFCSLDCFDKYREFEQKEPEMGEEKEEFIPDKSKLNDEMINKFLNMIFTTSLFNSKQDMDNFFTFITKAKTKDQLVRELKNNQIVIDDEFFEGFNKMYIFSMKNVIIQVAEVLDINVPKEDMETIFETFKKIMSVFDEQ